jgi:hypothetical protein
VGKFFNLLEEKFRLSMDNSLVKLGTNSMQFSERSSSVIPGRFRVDSGISVNFLPDKSEDQASDEEKLP